MEININKFTLKNMTKSFDEIMSIGWKQSNMPETVSLKLPKLKKTKSKNTSPTIKLPKLKKVTKEVTV